MSKYTVDDSKYIKGSYQMNEAFIPNKSTYRFNRHYFKPRIRVSTRWYENNSSTDNKLYFEIKVWYTETMDAKKCIKYKLNDTPGNFRKVKLKMSIDGKVTKTYDGNKEYSGKDTVYPTKSVLLAHVVQEREGSVTAGDIKVVMKVSNLMNYKGDGAGGYSITVPLTVKRPIIKKTVKFRKKIDDTNSFIEAQYGYKSTIELPAQILEGAYKSGNYWYFASGKKDGYYFYGWKDNDTSKKDENRKHQIGSKFQILKSVSFSPIAEEIVNNTLTYSINGNIRDLFSFDDTFSFKDGITQTSPNVYTLKENSVQKETQVTLKNYQSAIGKTVNPFKSSSRYTFLGWGLTSVIAREEDSILDATIRQCQATIKQDCLTQKKDMHYRTLYPVIQKNKATVKFKINDSTKVAKFTSGEGEELTTTLYFGESYDINSLSLISGNNVFKQTPIGKRLKGWSFKSTIKNDDELLNIFKLENATTTIYAIWEDIPYTIDAHIFCYKSEKVEEKTVETLIKYEEIKNMEFFLKDEQVTEGSTRASYYELGRGKTAIIKYEPKNTNLGRTKESFVPGLGSDIIYPFFINGATIVESQDKDISKNEYTVTAPNTYDPNGLYKIIVEIKYIINKIGTISLNFIEAEKKFQLVSGFSDSGSAFINFQFCDQSAPSEGLLTFNNWKEKFIKEIYPYITGHQDYLNTKDTTLNRPGYTFIGWKVEKGPSSMSAVNHLMFDYILFDGTLVSQTNDLEVTIDNINKYSIKLEKEKYTDKDFNLDIDLHPMWISRSGDMFLNDNDTNIKLHTLKSVGVDIENEGNILFDDFTNIQDIEEIDSEYLIQQEEDMLLILLNNYLYSHHTGFIASLDYINEIMRELINELFISTDDNISPTITNGWAKDEKDFFYSVYQDESLETLISFLIDEIVAIRFQQNENGKYDVTLVVTKPTFENNIEVLNPNHEEVIYLNEEVFFERGLKKEITEDNRDEENSFNISNFDPGYLLSLKQGEMSFITKSNNEIQQFTNFNIKNIYFSSPNEFIEIETFVNNKINKIYTGKSSIDKSSEIPQFQYEIIV